MNRMESVGKFICPVLYVLHRKCLTNNSTPMKRLISPTSLAFSFLIFALGCQPAKEVATDRAWWKEAIVYPPPLSVFFTDKSNM